MAIKYAAKTGKFSWKQELKEGYRRNQTRSIRSYESNMRVCDTSKQKMFIVLEH